MRREESQVFQNIQKVQKNQGLLLEKAKTAQQELFQLYAQRFLVSKQMLHKNIDQVLTYLPGTFAHVALNMLYLSVCIQMRVQLNTEDHPLLKKLVEWSQGYTEMRLQKQAKITANVLPKNEISAFREYEEYLTYINFIGGDLVKLLKKQKNQKDQNLTENTDISTFLPLDSDDLLVFLLNSLPKVLYNIILPNDVLPPNLRNKFKSMQILYKVSSHEYFIKSKITYSALIKILVNLLVKVQLKPAQQKLMMEIVFRYFFAYHNDKKFNATDIFISAYNTLSQTTRFAMADEFVLFFKIIAKVGKAKFVDFLVQKSAWLKEINAKVSDKNMVGYAKQSFSPFSNLKITETITIPHGKTETRSFEIIQDFSLLYFSIEVVSYDINLKLYYLGEINDNKAVKTLLTTQQKLCGQFRTNLMATKSGIYQFEFDNSYSWINGKTIRFEKVLLTPVQLQIPQQPKWISGFYDNVNLNKMADRSKVYFIQNAKPEPQEVQYQGTANITKQGKFFNMKIVKGSNVYEFQTASEEKLVKKFNEMIEKDAKLKWLVAGESLEQKNDLKRLISKNVETAERERETKVQKKEKIDSKYEQLSESPNQKVSTTQDQEIELTKNASKEQKQGSKEKL